MARGLVALAMLAALLGVPRPVTAAVNELSAAQVSPTAGTVTTVFVMRVRYDGGFAATSVTVTVAGAPRPMVLEHGTFSSGTWILETPLPAGTWPLTFAAEVRRGSSPRLVGPTVSVAVAPVATPTEPPRSAATAPPSPGSIDEQGDDPGTVDEPDVAAAASVTPAPASGEPLSAPSTSATDGVVPTVPEGAPAPSASRAATGDGATGKGAAASGTDRHGSDTARRQPRDLPMPNPPGEDAAPAGGDDDPATGARSVSPIEPDGLLGMVLVIGLIGVAAVALVGTLLLVAGRRRPDPEEPAALAVGAAPEVTATDDLLTRRTLQRARMRLADDPILSALGVDEQMEARRNRRARHVATHDRPDGDA